MKLHAVKHNPARKLPDLLDMLELVRRERASFSREELAIACERYGIPDSKPSRSTPTTTEAIESDLDLPGRSTAATWPPPEQTMEEWVDWLEWCRVHLVGPEKFKRWALDPGRAPVEVAFVLRGL